MLSETHFNSECDKDVVAGFRDFHESVPVVTIEFYESYQDLNAIAGEQQMMRLLTMVIVLIVGASQALAQATVKAKGHVFMNNTPISGSVTANPGATVSAGETGYATIYYRNGCTKVVGALQTHVVEDDPVCDQGAYYDYDKKTALIVGGLAVAGFVGIIYGLDDDDDKPVSP